MPVPNTTKTGMSIEQHLNGVKLADSSIWGIFKLFWPTWVGHVDRYEKHGEDEIIIHFKKDGYITNGATYIFSVADDRADLQQIESV